jgi:hypothetical protein
MLPGCVPVDNEQITGRSLLNLGALMSVSPNASPDASDSRNRSIPTQVLCDLELNQR